MKKVLIITYYWPPSGGAGVQRWLKFVKYLHGDNIEITVITVDPKKASYPITDKSLLVDIPEGLKVFYTDTFEPFEFYKFISRKKQIPFGGFANEKKETFVGRIFKFLRGNLFVPDARIGWNRYAIKMAEQIIQKEKIDVLLTTSPPHSTQLIGLYLKEKYKIPWISDIRDPWTDIYYYDKLYHLKTIKNIDADFERKVLEKADKVFVVSHFIKKLFESKSVLVNSDKIHVIPNGFDESDFFVERNFESSFVITYTGTLTSDYRPGLFFHALKTLIEKYTDDKIIFRFIGSMSGSVQDLIKNSGLSNNFEHIDYLSHKNVIPYLLSTSVLFHAIPDVKNNEGIITGKLFEYLAAKKFIICIGPNNGEASKIINECKSGIVIDWDNSGELDSVLESLFLKWKKEGKLLLHSDGYKKYSRKELSKKVLNEIMNLD